jgi:hypothetical protein
VQARHDPVELGEQLLGQVERAVRQDVHLDPRQEPQAVLLLQRGVQLADARHLRAQPLGVQAQRARAGVVGDGEVAQAQPLRLLDQLGQGRARVGRVLGVHVEVAAQVALLDQLRQPALLGGLELARPLAQLRRDPRQPHGAEDLLLGRPPSRRSSRSKIPYSLSLRPRWTARVRTAMLCALLPVK